MTVGWQNIQVDGKSVRAYVGVPEHKGPVPGILIAHHIGGVNEFIPDVVHRLYRQGYASAAPELFHRQPAEVADQRKRSAMLVDTEMIADLKATIALFQGLPVKIAPLGVVGFCLGGRVSYLAATAFSEIKAAAVFYGGGILQPRGTTPTPFERTADIQCPIIAFSGEHDTNPSPEDMRKVDAELTRLNKPHEFHLYRDTDHAFMNFTGDRYRERAARAGWAEMLAFFDQHLKRAG